MALSVYATRFKEHCQKAETIRLTRYAPGTQCPGGIDQYSGRWDPALDREYHEENPSQPVCVDGRIGAATTTEDVKAFVSQGINEQQRVLLSLGEFEVDDMLYLGPADVPLRPTASTEVAASTSTITEAEFPIGSGRTFRLFRPDLYWFRGNPVYWYVRLERQTEDEA